ncbi:MAG: hypothetical protein WCF84_13445 [Anaerolineae bacterium]
MQKYWREVYLSVMMVISLSILVASAVSLSDLAGLSTAAVGVFVGVLGVGMYDSWYESLAKANNKIKIKR